MLNKLALFSILALLFASAMGDYRDTIFADLREALRENASPPDEIKWPDSLSGEVEWPEARILYREIDELVLSAHKRTDRVRTAVTPQLVLTDDSTVTEEHLHLTEVECINMHHDGKKSVAWRCIVTNDNKSPLVTAILDDVYCEGWRDDDDHYVRAGSCMVYYTLTYADDDDDYNDDDDQWNMIIAIMQSTFLLMWVIAVMYVASTLLYGLRGLLEYATPTFFAVLACAALIRVSQIEDDDDKSEPESVDTANPALPTKHTTATDLETNTIPSTVTGVIPLFLCSVCDIYEARYLCRATNCDHNAKMCISCVQVCDGEECCAHCAETCQNEAECEIGEIST